MTIGRADIAAIKALPLFKGVATRVVGRLLQRAQLHEFAAGSVLFRQDEPAQSLYIALDGHVALKFRDATQEAIIEFVPAGQPFIIAAVLLNRPFLTTAHVIETTRVVLIPAEAFRAAVDEDHNLSLALNRIAAEHWRSLVGQIRSLKMRTGTQRLAAFLMSLVDRRIGEATVSLPCDRSVLAAWLGIVPTSASRAFKDLAALGVEGHGRHVRIRSLGRLAEFAGMTYV